MKGKGYELPNKYYELNPDLLQEQQLPLSTEPSPQPHLFFYY